MGTPGQRLPAWAFEPGTSPYAVELLKLRNANGIPMLRQKGVQGYPLLLAKARELSPRRRNDSEAVADMLKMAINEAAEFDSGEADAPRFDERFRAAAAWEFGFSTDSDVKTPQDRRKMAAKEFNVHLDNFRTDGRYERLLIGRIAQTIETLKLEHPDDEFPLYVGRPRLDESIHELMAMPESEWRWEIKRRICIVGEPGTGKTWYAKHLAASSDSVWIDAESPDSMDRCIAKVLRRYGVDSRGDHTYRLLDFIELLQGPNAPQLAIFDNLARSQELEGILPEPTRTWIISTSQVKPRQDWAPILQVDSLEDDEALDLVERIYPAQDRIACANLCRILGGRAIAVAQVSAYLKNEASRTTIDEFLQLLEQDTISTLDSVLRQTESALSRVYLDSLRRLAVESPESVAVLETIMFGYSFVSSSVVKAYLLGDAKRVYTQPLRSRLIYMRAIQPLQDLCLIEEGENGLSIHSLTRAVMMRILGQQSLTKYFNSWTRVFAPIIFGDLIELFPAGWEFKEVLNFCLNGASSCIYFMNVMPGLLPEELRGMMLACFAPGVSDTTVIDGDNLAALWLNWRLEVFFKYSLWMEAGQPSDCTALKQADATSWAIRLHIASPDALKSLLFPIPDDESLLEESKIDTRLLSMRDFDWE